MTAVGIPISYEGPKVIKPRVSLLESVEVVDHVDERFAGGIDISYDPCGDASIGLWEYCVADPDPLPAGPYSTVATFNPFTISAGVTCSSYSNYTEQDFILKADRLLEANISKKLEAELWTGATVGNDHLAQASGTDLTGATAIAPGIAVAALEQALGHRGVIHMSPLVLGGLLAAGSDSVYEEIDPQTGALRYFTFMGNPIVAGYGYPGTDESGGNPTATAEWMYASGPVVVHRGPIVHPAKEKVQAVSTTTNDFTYYAQQTAIATFDVSCGLYSAKVNRGYTVI